MVTAIKLIYCWTLTLTVTLSYAFAVVEPLLRFRGAASALPWVACEGTTVIALRKHVISDRKDDVIIVYTTVTSGVDDVSIFILNRKNQ